MTTDDEAMARRRRMRKGKTSFLLIDELQMYSGLKRRKRIT